MIDLLPMQETPISTLAAIVSALVALLSFILTLTVILRSGSRDALSGYVKAQLDAFRLQLDEDLQARDTRFAETFGHRDQRLAEMFDKRDALMDRTYARADLTDMRFKHIEHRLTRTNDQLTVLLEAEVGRIKNLASELARKSQHPERGEDPER